VPPHLAEKAIIRDGRKFLLIQSAVVVEVEACEDVGSPCIVNGMVVFPDTNKPPLTIPNSLGIPLPNWNTVVLWPHVTTGKTLDEQLKEGLRALYRELEKMEEE